MPRPAPLYCLGGCLFIQIMWSRSGCPTLFRMSSTPKGGKVYPSILLHRRYRGCQRQCWSTVLRSAHGTVRGKPEVPAHSVPALAIAVTLTPLSYARILLQI